MDGRDFLESYQITHIETDPLPIKVLRNTITKEEISGQAVYWGFEYLNQKSCPLTLLFRILQKLYEEIPVTDFLHCADNVAGTDDGVDSCGLELGARYEPLKLMHAVVKKLDEICLKEREDVHDSVDGMIESPDMLPHVHAVAYNNIKNARRFMEDRMTVMPRMDRVFNLAAPISYFAVFDGHNGSEAAEYGAAQLHQYIIEAMKRHNDMIDCISDAFESLDDSFIKKCAAGKVKSGSTAVLSVLMPDKLYVGWVGDSQAVLVKQNNDIHNLVTPHKPDRMDEIERIRNLGGDVLNMSGTCRVNGNLAVSRAIGDADDKKFIIATPDIKMMELDGCEEFLILACDGLWDEITPEVAAHIVRRQVVADPCNLSAVSQKLIQQAKQKGSADNISVIVVFLEPLESIKNRYENTIELEVPADLAITKQSVDTIGFASPNQLIEYNADGSFSNMAELNGHAKGEQMVDFLLGNPKGGSDNVKVELSDSCEKGNISAEDDHDVKEEVEDLSDAEEDDEWQFEKPHPAAMGAIPSNNGFGEANDLLGADIVNDGRGFTTSPIVEQVQAVMADVERLKSNTEGKEQDTEESITLINERPRENVTESYNPFTGQVTAATAVSRSSAELAELEEVPKLEHDNHNLLDEDLKFEAAAGAGKEITTEIHEQVDEKFNPFSDELVARTAEEAFDTFANQAGAIFEASEALPPPYSAEVVTNPFGLSGTEVPEHINQQFDNICNEAVFESSGILATFENIENPADFAAGDLVQLERNPIPEDFIEDEQETSTNITQDTGFSSNPFSEETTSQGFNAVSQVSENETSINQPQSNPFEMSGAQLTDSDIFEQELANRGPEQVLQTVDEVGQFVGAAVVDAALVSTTLKELAQANIPELDQRSNSAQSNQSCEILHPSRDIEGTSSLDMSEELFGNDGRPTPPTQKGDVSPIILDVLVNNDLQDPSLTDIPTKIANEELAKTVGNPGTANVIREIVSTPSDEAVSPLPTEVFPEREETIQSEIERDVKPIVGDIGHLDDNRNLLGSPIPPTPESDQIAETIEKTTVEDVRAPTPSEVVTSVNGHESPVVPKDINQDLEKVATSVEIIKLFPAPPAPVDSGEKLEKPADAIKSKTESKSSASIKATKSPMKIDPNAVKSRTPMSSAPLKKSPSKPTADASRTGLANGKSATGTKPPAPKVGTMAMKSAPVKATGSGAASVTQRTGPPRPTGSAARPTAARTVKEPVDAKARPPIAPASKPRPATAPTAPRIAPVKPTTTSPKKTPTSTGVASSRPTTITRPTAAGLTKPSDGESKLVSTSSSLAKPRPKPTSTIPSRAGAKPESKPLGVESKKPLSQSGGSSLAAKTTGSSISKAAPKPSVGSRVPSTSARTVPPKTTTTAPPKPAASRVASKPEDKTGALSRGAPSRTGPSARAPLPLKKVESTLKAKKPSPVASKTGTAPVKVTRKPTSEKSEAIEQNGVSIKKEEDPMNEMNAINGMNGDHNGETEKQDPVKENGTHEPVSGELPSVPTGDLIG